MKLLFWHNNHLKWLIIVRFELFYTVLVHYGWLLCDPSRFTQFLSIMIDYCVIRSVLHSSSPLWRIIVWFEQFYTVTVHHDWLLCNSSRSTQFLSIMFDNCVIRAVLHSSCPSWLIIVWFELFYTVSRFSDAFWSQGKHIVYNSRIKFGNPCDLTVGSTVFVFQNDGQIFPVSLWKFFRSI